MARLLVIALVVSVAIFGSTPRAVGAAEWCDTDPVLVIETPGGALVTVYLLVGALGAEHLPAAQAASLLAANETVKSVAGGQATRVTVTVTVPDDPFASGFPTRATVSSLPLGSGVVYDATEGTSGAPMTLRFTLPIP